VWVGVLPSFAAKLILLILHSRLWRALQWPLDGLQLIHSPLITECFDVCTNSALSVHCEAPVTRGDSLGARAKTSETPDLRRPSGWWLIRSPPPPPPQDANGLQRTFPGGRATNISGADLSHAPSDVGSTFLSIFPITEKRRRASQPDNVIKTNTPPPHTQWGSPPPPPAPKGFPPGGVGCWGPHQPPPPTGWGHKGPERDGNRAA